MQGAPARLGVRAQDDVAGGESTARMHKRVTATVGPLAPRATSRVMTWQ
jgi:hypothetical protein